MKKQILHENAYFYESNQVLLPSLKKSPILPGFPLGLSTFSLKYVCMDDPSSMGNKQSHNLRPHHDHYGLVVNYIKS